MAETARWYCVEWRPDECALIAASSQPYAKTGWRHTKGVLQEWLRQSEYRKLAGLVTKLRIEEAQRVLVEHRDWSVESVADYCGFNDRKYFHQVFQQYTGTTPAKYQANN